MLTFKMNLTSFPITLVVTLLIHSAIAQPIDSSKQNLSETPNKHASPQLYVFGGWDYSQPESARVLSSASQFNSSTGKWKATTRMTMSRERSCGAMVGTKIYLFGGVGGENDSPTATESAEVYDCETGFYSTFVTIPHAPLDCGAAVLDGSIYIAGDRLWYGWRKTSSEVLRYNIRTGRKENVSSLNIIRSSLQLVELDGRLYAIGGGESGDKTVEAYNATTDQWTYVASTHYEHEDFGAAVHEGKIYVFSNNGFEVYSPEADQWEVLTPPNDYQGISLVSMNGQLWALGGNTGGTTATKNVFTYNITTKEWTQQADMDVARNYFPAFVVNH